MHFFSNKCHFVALKHRAKYLFKYPFLPHAHFITAIIINLSLTQNTRSYIRCVYSIYYLVNSFVPWSRHLLWYRVCHSHQLRDSFAFPTLSFQPVFPHFLFNLSLFRYCSPSLDSESDFSLSTIWGLMFEKLLSSAIHSTVTHFCNDCCFLQKKTSVTCHIITKS